MSVPSPRALAPQPPRVLWLQPPQAPGTRKGYCYPLLTPGCVFFLLPPAPSLLRGFPSPPSWLSQPTQWAEVQLVASEALPPSCLQLPRRPLYTQRNFLSESDAHWGQDQVKFSETFTGRDFQQLQSMVSIILMGKLSV